ADGGLGTPPFGTVNLTQNGTKVDVTVHLNPGYWFVLTGAADMQDFKFNAVDVVPSDITVVQNAPASVGTLVASAGAYNGDGTGNFGFGITGTTQGGGGSGKFNSDIIFTVKNATIADLTVPNNLGNIFVADLLSDFTGKTGPADVSTPPTVPDGGATVALLGVGLLGLGALRRKS
ncbi:MAG TPA: VPDSG-CTERM sorting domain-containing protein, partial [Verrucomicrobiae bacterium]